MNSQRENYKKAKYTFAVAEMHYRAAQSLLEIDHSDTDDIEPSLLPPGYTLYSLAIELYLKCLYFENGQNPPRSHDLLKLFEGLNDTAKSIIEHGYNKLFQDSDWARAVKLHYPDGDFSLRGVLKEAKDGFETWRYFHEATLENRRNMISFSLYEVLPAIRAFIITSYPNWREVSNSEILGENSSLVIPPRFSDT